MGGLLKTEEYLLSSNRIDRKTILLNHMQMYDKSVAGVPDVDAMQKKYEDLVKKLGTERI